MGEVNSWQRVMSPPAAGGGGSVASELLETVSSHTLIAEGGVEEDEDEEIWIVITSGQFTNSTSPNIVIRKHDGPGSGARL